MCECLSVRDGGGRERGKERGRRGERCLLQVTLVLWFYISGVTCTDLVVLDCPYPEVDSVWSSIVL